MSDYQDIRGTRVKYLSSDPTLESSYEGQVWYNSTTGVNKTLIEVKAFTSAGILTKGRYELGGVGTQTAGLAFGGNRAVTSPTGLQTDTEEFNGTGWTNGGSLPAAKATQGFGIQTAAVACGGTIAPNPTAGTTTEEYNGSSWTSGGALNTATTGQAASTGLESAGLRAGGGSSPSARLSAVEEYNGSAWTSVTSLPAERFEFQGTGPQTASFFTGGSTSVTTETDDTFNYDGTNWTSGPTMPFGLRKHGVSGNSSTANLSFGGEQAPGGRNLSVLFDGSSFSADATLGTGRNALGGFGAAKAAVACGGNNAPSYELTATEEYNSSINEITVGAWASGGNLLYPRSSMAGGGTQTAAIEGSGSQNNPDTSPTTSSEYDGSSWTAGNTTPANFRGNNSATGTQTAVITGGLNNASNTETFEYNGSSWTAGGDIGTGRYKGGCFGTQTAAAFCGGRVSPPTLNNVEEYNGSSWTAVTAMPFATRQVGAGGTQTAGIIHGGFQGPTSPPLSPTNSISRGKLTLEYDGSSWTTGGSSNTGRDTSASSGIQTLLNVACGNTDASNNSNTTENYNGTSWVTGPNTSIGRADRASASSRTSAVGTACLIFGGTPSGGSPEDSNNTEEFTAETTAIASKTLTTS